MLANKIYWEDSAFYNYRLTNENASSYKKNNPDDVFDIYDYLNLFLQQYPERYKKIKPHFYIEIYRHMFWNLGRVDEKYKKYCIRRIHKVFSEMKNDFVQNCEYFTPAEKRTFYIYASPFYAQYKWVPYIKHFLQQIFSLKNSRDKRHKIVRFLGLKIKIRRKK